jgi:hypothetical protein
MLPGLAHGCGKDLTVPQGVLRLLYDECIRKAAIEVLPGESGHWPPSYDSEMKRMRDKRGQLNPSTKRIPAHSVNSFGRSLLRRVKAFSWGQSAFFLHQFRGTRGATVHDPTLEAEVAALDDYLLYVNPYNLIVDNWYIDIGMEIQDPGYVIWWRPEAFWRLIRGILETTDENAARISELKTFYRDPAAQLSDAGGFRYAPTRSNSGQRQVAYVQAYNTEKSPTYSLADQRKVALHLPVQRALMDSKAAETYASDLISIFLACVNDGYDGHARLEVRVPLREAGFHFLPEDPAELSQCLVSIERKVWW